MLSEIILDFNRLYKSGNQFRPLSRTIQSSNFCNQHCNLSCNLKKKKVIIRNNYEIKARDKNTLMF